MTERHEIWTILDKLEMDAKALSAKIAALRMQVACIDLPDGNERVKCPACGVPFRSERALSEHRYHSHAGPLPESYRAAERLAGLDDL